MSFGNISLLRTHSFSFTYPHSNSLSLFHINRIQMRYIIRIHTTAHSSYRLCLRYWSLFLYPPFQCTPLICSPFLPHLHYYYYISVITNLRKITIIKVWNEPHLKEGERFYPSPCKLFLLSLFTSLSLPPQRSISIRLPMTEGLCSEYTRTICYFSHLLAKKPLERIRGLLAHQ